METFDVRLKTPFTLILAGASGCGKTTWLERFLKEFKTVTDGASKYQTLLWFSGTKQPALFQRVRTSFAGTVRFFDSIDKEVYEQVEKQGRNSTIVIDDLMQETSGMAGVGKLFTKGRSHLNCNVILLWQNVFPNGSEARNLSINAHHMVLFKNPRDKSQIRYFAQQGLLEIAGPGPPAPALAPRPSSPGPHIYKCFQNFKTVCLFPNLN